MVKFSFIYKKHFTCLQKKFICDVPLRELRPRQLNDIHSYRLDVQESTQSSYLYQNTYFLFVVIIISLCTLKHHSFILEASKHRR